LTYKNLQRYFYDLLTGKWNLSPEEALSAFSTWGPVHGSNANYTRMALALVDGYFGNTATIPADCATAHSRCQASQSGIHLLLLRFRIRGWAPDASALKLQGPQI
jgi:hypothetical protein